MERSIESLRIEFLRILDEIEKITNGDKEYEPSKYESCIKIDGKPILPPLMTKGKKICLKYIHTVHVEIVDSGFKQGIFHFFTK